MHPSAEETPTTPPPPPAAQTDGAATRAERADHADLGDGADGGTGGAVPPAPPLAPLLPLLAGVEELDRARRRVAAGDPVLLGVPDAAKVAVVAALWAASGAPLLLIVPREREAEAAAETLRAWAGAAVSHYPARRALPYAREGEDPETAAARVAVAAALTRVAAGAPHERTAPPLVVASAAAVAERTLAPADLGRGPGELRVGDRRDLGVLARELVDAGYAVEPLVERPGQAARRGGLLDVFPPGAPAPVRIEFFGDEVESIRRFSVTTQRTAGHLDHIFLPPATEWFVEAAARRELAAALGHADAPRTEAAEADHAALAAGGLPAPLRYGPLAARHTLLDHLPAAALVVLDEREAVLAAALDHDELARERRAELARQGDLGTDAPLPHAAQEELATALGRVAHPVELGRWVTGREPGAERLPFAPADAYAGRLPEATTELERMRRRGDRLVVATQQAQRLGELLAPAGLATAVEAALTTAPAGGTLALLQLALPAGWRLALPGGQLTLVTDREIFGFVKRRRTLGRATTRRGRFFSEIEPGDVVVHADHGIARFAGITRREVSGEARDYLELRFAAGDRLYVPTEHVDRVTRYVGPSGHAPRLTRLGTQEWTRTRQRVREAVEIVAADLLRLYAARQLLEGHACAPDGEWQRELEAAFPHEETDDQLRAIAEVKADMESGRPMDRVVCGDVGFGKTEVAVRAAFKAVQDGLQVAVLVPTTVLAEQHARTFRERLAPFPVRVEVLSRFRSDHEIAETRAALRAGEVDIVIGTHRLLQPDVEFARLGLVVIDEEQRFGVTHKERLKRMRLEVDVLSLSATPIPRTMHMALTGIRDMSSIDTAPVERLPVVTYVTEWDGPLVREAILHELERGGQTYIVHNRVHSIDRFAEELAALVPEARIATGHGQMPEAVLRGVMERFAEGEFDVLVCTTIIESGIDIPNVNTLIVDRADRFGLAQLYQLRGRVGRGGQQAYAYLLHPAGRPLSEVAQQRLATIFEASDLGAGFQVALRDLEIRGAGNLLGAQQSGQIATVGFELYTEMLGQAVTELRARTRGLPEPSAPATPGSATPASTGAASAGAAPAAAAAGAGERPVGAARGARGGGPGSPSPFAAPAADGRPVVSPRPPAVGAGAEAPAAGGRVDPAVVRRVVVDLPVAAHIPETYAPEIEARLALYQRIAGLGATEEVAALAAETRDRLGELPAPLAQLLQLVRLRIAAAAAGVGQVRLDRRPGGAEEVVLVAREGAPFSTRRLPRLPAGVERLRMQVRVPRAALGADWLTAIEALIGLVAPLPDPPRPPAAARPGGDGAAR